MRHLYRIAAATAAAATLLLGGAGTAGASEVQIWRADSQAAFLAGELVDVSVDRLGVLRLAQRAEQFATLSEPFLFSFAGANGRFAAGTGNSGKVLEIAAGADAGSVTELFAAEEPEIFAVWVDADGAVYAGSSPDGKVYRKRPDGEVEAVFDPEAKYIWALLGDGDGGLLVGTGPEGKLHRVDLSSGESTLLYDSTDLHIRSLARRADGTLFAGTAGEGLLLEIDAAGSARTLYDAAGPEVLAIVRGDEGAFYATALASEASFVDLSSVRRSASGSPSSSGSGGAGSAGGGATESNGQSTQVTSQAGAISVGSRAASFKGPRSEVLRIDASGSVESIWKFEAETVYALSYQQGRLWVATGQEGKLFSYQNEQMVLEKDLDQGQIVGLAEGPAGPVFASTNAAAVYGFVGGGSGGLAERGTVTAKPLDASAVASFGSIRWRGRAGDGVEVALSARSGRSSTPDETWSGWTTASAAREAPLSDLPPGRYLQWRAELRGGGDRTPEVVAVEVTYRQHNRKPEIKKLDVLPAGTILVPTNFNPSNQAYEPAHPNRDRIFTVVGDPAQTQSGSTKTLWKLGYRTLRWEAEDLNKDRLRYRLSFAREAELAAASAADGDGRREGPSGGDAGIRAGSEDATGTAAAGNASGGGAANAEGKGADAPWLEMADDVKAAFLSFDATVLPDGLYRFRVEATDRLDNVAGEALQAERISAAVIVDHSPARLVEASRDGGRVRAVVEDDWSPLREAVVSVDAGEWRAASVEDGLLDSQRETLSIDAAEGVRLLLLRLTDAAHNVTTIDLSGQLGGGR